MFLFGILFLRYMLKRLFYWNSADIDSFGVYAFLHQVVFHTGRSYQIIVGIFVDPLVMGTDISDTGNQRRMKIMMPFIPADQLTAQRKCGNDYVGISLHQKLFQHLIQQ